MSDEATGRVEHVSPVLVQQRCRAVLMMVKSRVGRSDTNEKLDTFADETVARSRSCRLGHALPRDSWRWMAMDRMW